MPNIMGAVAKHCFLVTDPTRLEATVRTAFEIARTGRPGPVVIDIPKDVQNWQGTFQGEGHLDVRGYRQRMNALRRNAVTDDECEAFFAMLARVGAAADLRRRRRDPRRGVRGAARASRSTSASRSSPR